MSNDIVHLDVAGPIATVTLDSPENRNALSRALTAALEEQLSAAIDDDRARAIILTHTGSVFCAGADLKEMRSPEAAGGPSGNDRIVPIMKRILRSPKPVIARIGGPARAGGIGLIAACDIAVASQDATFAFSEVRVGVVPAMISVVVLPKLGPAKAMELFLTGDTVGAAEAERLGLVNAAVPAAELDARVARYTESILKGAPGALAGSKRLVHQASLPAMDEAFDSAIEMSAEYFTSDEAREGMQAFAEKRPPRWAAPGE